MPTAVYGDFERDEDKAAVNEAKHGVRFEEAAQAFTDPLSMDFADTVHPDRLVTLAMSPAKRILYVVRTDRGARTHPHRTASRNDERRIYEGSP